MNNFCRNCSNFPGEGKVCPIGEKLINDGNNNSCGHFSKRESQEVESTINPGDKQFPETTTIEILKKDREGNLKVLESFPKGSNEGVDYVIIIGKLKKIDKEECPYSFRYV